MSEILFKNLTIENFMSIGHGSLALDNRGLLLIQGQNTDDSSANSNGAGKSSTVDALCWALYGETARGLSGDAVVNRFEGKNCRVSVTFTFNGKTYEVARHRKHKTGKNRLLFTCDGADLTLGTDKLTQDIIEKTIGCPLDVFTASIYAGQERMPNLPAMTDKELKQLVESAAGIELLDASYIIARDRAKIAANVVQTAQHSVALSEAAKLAAHQRLSSKIDMERQWEEGREQRIADETAKFRKLVTAATDAKARLAAMDKPALQAEVEAAEEALAQALSKSEASIPSPILQPQKPMPAENPSPLFAVRSTKEKLDRKKREATEILASLKNLQASVGTPCSECSKPYEERDLAGRAEILKSKASVLRGEIVDMNAVLTELEKIRQDNYDEYQEVVRQVQNENDAIKAANAEARATHAAALEAQRLRIASLDTSALRDRFTQAQRALYLHETATDQYTDAIALAQAGKVELERVKAMTNPNTADVPALRVAVQDAEDAYQDVRNKLDEANVKLGDHEVVVELFSPKGMRGEILDTVTPFLNARTAEYLGALSDGAITAEWKTVGETGKGELREKFHIAVSNINGAEVYEGQSGGEQRKVRISTAMALQDLVATRADRPIKLFVADEVDDSLDVSGLERLMGILENKARHVGSVLIISHNDLGDWINQQVVVVKTGGKSELVEV